MREIVVDSSAIFAIILDEEDGPVFRRVLGDSHPIIGRGTPPAVLNLGDSFSYALAGVRNLPLLYKGNDFAKTDLRSALDPEGQPGP